MSKELKRFYAPDYETEYANGKRGQILAVAASDYDALLAERDALKAELADLVRVVGMSVDGSSARNKAMEKAFAALQGAQP